MTCHCGNCEDHRVDSWKMIDLDSFQWTEAVIDEVKDELFGNNKTPIVIKSNRPNSLAGYYGKNPEERTKMVMDNKDGTTSPDVGVPAGDPPRGGSGIQAPDSQKDKYDEEYYANYVAPTPYENWIGGAQYLTKEELADRYARYGVALAEIHKMALDSFCGKKDLPEPKYMLGLCLGLAGGALNYEFRK